jgi:hypothetical protein
MLLAGFAALIRFWYDYWKQSPAQDGFVDGNSRLQGGGSNGRDAHTGRDFPLFAAYAPP